MPSLRRREIGAERGLRRDRGGCSRDDAAAKHPGLARGRIVKGASLSRRDAVLAGEQFDLDIAGAAAQPRRLWRPGRAHFHVNLGAALHRLIERAVAEPVDLAELNAARAQRLARADHDAARGASSRTT